MRAIFINEVNFERGRDPKEAMGIGSMTQLNAEVKKRTEENWRWDNMSEVERIKFYQDELKDLLPRTIRGQRFEDVRTLLEQPDKIYKARIKQGIVDLVWGAADKKRTYKESNERQEAAIEFMPYLLSKGANPKFRAWSAYKDACEYALPKFIKKFIDDYGCDPHMDGDMPMRRLVELNVKHYTGNTEMTKRLWESMQVLLDEFKK